MKLLIKTCEVINSSNDCGYYNKVVKEMIKKIDVYFEEVKLNLVSLKKQVPSYVKDEQLTLEL